MGDGDSYAKLFTPTAKRIGRPKGSGNIKPIEHKCIKPVKLTPELYKIVDSEMRYGETISDTILRMIREKSYKFIDSQKKVDALQERLRELETQRRFSMPLLNNKGITI